MLVESSVGLNGASVLAYSVAGVEPCYQLIVTQLQLGAADTLAQSCKLQGRSRRSLQPGIFQPSMCDLQSVICAAFCMLEHDAYNHRMVRAHHVAKCSP
jgi:hypothetical protein